MMLLLAEGFVRNGWEVDMLLAQATDNPTDPYALKPRAADFAVAPAIAQHVAIAREVMEAFA